MSDTGRLQPEQAKPAGHRGEATAATGSSPRSARTRLTGPIRVAVPSEALEARLSGLPAGVSPSNQGGSRCASAARRTPSRLFALAQALTHDYEQFEALVDGATPGAAGER